MRIVLFRGSRGTGKTLTMVKTALEYHKLGWKVFTNLSQTPFYSITSEFILDLSGKSQLRDCVLAIDEIELFFDSREWNKKESRYFSRFLQQIRKRNVVILCTSQFTNLIDIRLRQQIDTLGICSFDKVNSLSFCTFVDLTSIETNPFNPKMHSIEYYAEPIFHCYNTSQIID